MSNPLLNTPRAPRPLRDDSGVPYGAYLRCIDFVDLDPPHEDEAPAHVVRRVLFDGVIPPARIAKDGVTVDLAWTGGTVVTMHVHPDDVQIGTEGQPYLIGGRHVLSPVGEGWDWVPVDENDPDSFIVCSVYVAKVSIR